MKRNVACTTAVLAFLLAGATTADPQRDYNINNFNLLRLFMDKPWLKFGSNARWDNGRQLDPETKVMDQSDMRMPRNDEVKNYDLDDISVGSDKRSAVATALNAGRRRRQPTPALGKAVTPYIGVGVLNDVGNYLDSLRDNLEAYASFSPHQRSTLLKEPPTVVQAPTVAAGGGGIGMGRLHALRPLRPVGNIRSYHRRSLVDSEGEYPRANNHDPALLWTGLGR